MIPTIYKMFQILHIYEYLSCCHSSCWSSLWEVTQKSVYLSRGKHQHSAKVEATNPFQILPTQCQTHYTVLQPTLCAVDVHEHESLSCYHSSCQPSFWKFPRFLIAFRGATHRSVQWLRLWTHLRWILNQCQTYKRCFTTFISSGCAYVIAHTVLPLLSSSKLLEGTTLNSGYIPRGKPQSSSV